MRLCLFPTLEAPSKAREGLAPLAERLEDDSLADLRTVISELVTISVAHGAADPIDVRLHVGQTELEGIVQDGGPGARALARSRQNLDDSLQLRIVDSLVDDWGTNPGETSVWFRMPLHPEESGR
ncbi:MAG TPA: ATP-binding protein [Solirubrobacterales bacterium]|jgi:anti-sigma regulatory factor (Ser/Thr protein kinase)